MTRHRCGHCNDTDWCLIKSRTSNTPKQSFYRFNHLYISWHKCFCYNLLISRHGLINHKKFMLISLACFHEVQYSSVQSLSHVWLFATSWTTAHQASLSITNSWSPPKPMSIELVMPSSHLILCFPLLLLPSIFPSARAFSNDSALHIRWPEYWSFSFSISPSKE